METVLVETCESSRTTGDDREVGRHFVRFLMDVDGSEQIQEDCSCRNPKEHAI
jgi:hypothetical protein